VRPFRTIGCCERDNVFAVRRRIVASRRAEPDDLLRINARLIRYERITPRSIRSHHKRAISSEAPKEKLVAAPPSGVATTVDRDLPFACLVRKCFHIYRVGARLIGDVCEPTSIRREHRGPLLESSVEEHFRLPGPKARAGVFYSHRPNVCPGCRVYFYESQPSAIGREGPRKLGILAFNQRLGVNCSGRAGPEDTTGRTENDVLAIGAPKGIGITAAERQPHHRRALEVVHPDVPI